MAVPKEESDPAYETFIMNVRKRAAQCNITHAQIAAATGYKRPMITHILNGQRKMNLSTCLIIADLLGCTLDDLAKNADAEPVVADFIRTGI